MHDPHNPRQPPEDGVLPEVEQAEALLHLQRHLLVPHQDLLIPLYLVRLIVEVLDRFVVQ